MRRNRWLLLVAAAVAVLLPPAQAQQPAAQQPRQAPQTLPILPKPLGQFVIGYLDTTAPLQPLVLDVADPNQTYLPRELLARYGFDKGVGVGFSVRRGTPNEDYRRARPFGNMELELENPALGNRVGGGLVAVQASRRVYSQDLETQRTIKTWRWRVPEALQNHAAEMGSVVYGDRYAALCLLPPVWQDEPTLMQFDTASGLKWQAGVPLRDALREYALRTYRTRTKPVNLSRGGAATSGAATGLISVHNTQDGSRTLLTIGWSEPYLTLLFVFDKQGKLLRTTIFPERIVLNIDRAPSANLFVVLAADDRAKNTSFLIDGDGNALGRFVGPSGTPLGDGSLLLSDTHALVNIDNKHPDGSRERYYLLYRFPALTSTETLPLAVSPRPATRPNEPGSAPTPPTNNKPRLPTVPPPEVPPNKR